MSFSISGNALSCLSRTMNQETFSKLDLIIKGKISLEKPPEKSKRRTSKSFTVKVLKSWKGAKKGDHIKVTYLILGGDGLPYTEGKTYIIYANKNGKKFITDGCMFFNFEMSKELEEFTQNPPYIDKSKPLPPHIKRLKSLANNLEEDTLDKLMKSAVPGKKQPKSK